MEAALATLVNICIDYGPNCRRLLVHGLDALIELAEAGAAAAKLMQEREHGGDDEFDYGETNGALAQDLLHIVGPYNYIVCANCGHRNESGTTCVQCGHAIAFDITEAKHEVAKGKGKGGVGSATVGVHSASQPPPPVPLSAT